MQRDEVAAPGLFRSSQHTEAFTEGLENIPLVGESTRLREGEPSVSDRLSPSFSIAVDQHEPEIALRDRLPGPGLGSLLDRGDEESLGSRDRTLVAPHVRQADGHVGRGIKPPKRKSRFPSPLIPGDRFVPTTQFAKRSSQEACCEDRGGLVGGRKSGLVGLAVRRDRRLEVGGVLADFTLGDQLRRGKITGRFGAFDAPDRPRRHPSGDLRRTAQGPPHLEAPIPLEDEEPGSAVALSQKHPRPGVGPRLAAA